MLNKNAKVYLGARSESKALEAIERLKAETGHTSIFLQLDLADLHSVRRAADEFISCVGSFFCLEFPVSECLRPGKKANCTFSSTTGKIPIVICCSSLLMDYTSSGVMTSPMDMLTAQGYDLQFGTNVLGTWLIRLSLRSTDNPSCRSFLLHKAPTPHARPNSTTVSWVQRCQGNQHIIFRTLLRRFGLEW